MLRSAFTRPLVQKIVKAPSNRSSYNAAATYPAVTAYSRLHGSKRLEAKINTSFRLGRPALRYSTDSIPTYEKIDSKVDAQISKLKLKPHPDQVSGGSSVRHVFEGGPNKEKDADMLGGIKSDLETIKETFALTDVPRESYYLGAAGLLPYIATSMSTVGLALDINHAHTTGSGYIFSPETAHQLLEIIEPIQIGYGAVIISFLGAIHWGLEYAAFGGKHGYNRYAIGVIAPAIAWPTIFMPVEYALITQFLAFNFLYFADARATVRGWCPPWYSTYRFVLTFFVGASIVISLVGRGRIVRKDGTLPSPTEKMQSLRDSQWENLEREEVERRRALADAEEKEDEDDESEEDEGGDDAEKDESDKDDKESKGDADDKKKEKKGNDSKGDAGDQKDKKKGDDSKGDAGDQKDEKKDDGKKDKKE